MIRDNQSEIAKLAAEIDPNSTTLDAGPKESPTVERLLELTPSGFERLCQRLLQASGFENVIVTGRTGDGGIDGLARYPLGLVSFSVAFQCKRWRSAVGAKDIRDFRGAILGKAEKGLFLATSRYTPSATNEARRNGTVPIDLIDGQRLCSLIHDHDRRGSASIPLSAQPQSAAQTHKF